MDARKRLNGTSRKVIQLFNDGLAPSQIDAMLRLPSGRSRQVIVLWWWSMKEADHG